MRAIGLVAIALAGGCAAPKAFAPPPKLAIADAAWDLEPCKSNLMLQHLFRNLQHTWPVPLDNTRGLEFKILYYPLKWAYEPKAPSYGPVASAVIDLESGTLLSCSYTTTAPKGLSGPPAPPRPAERARELYGMTEKISAIYAAGKEPTEHERYLAKQYLELFDSLAEPALLPDYEAINPGFWAWLRRAALK